MKNKERFIFIVLLLWSIFPSVLYGQNSRIVIDSLARSLENNVKKIVGSSIYIRTNKDIYETMEDLWFKTYTVDLKNLLLSPKDRSLYVQLIQEGTDSVVWQEIYPIEQGISSGHIYLDNSLKEGSYWLCAYTSSSVRNRKEHFVDARRIRIIESFKQLEGNKRDQKISKKEVEALEFKLFPEAGVFLKDVRNRVAFKAISKSGLPVEVTGKIYEGEREIGDFKSFHDGMGSFYIKPVSGKIYTVRLDQPYHEEIHSLPKISEAGMTFSLVSNSDDSLSFKVYNRDARAQSFYVQVQTRGTPSVIASGEVQDSLLLRLPLTDVPSGISEVTLLNSLAVPVAERLVYVKHNKMLTITAKISEEKAKKREKVSVKINAKDKDGNPVIAQLGATIYDRIYNDPLDQKDIQTHYLISNQIRGKIHNPTYYFDSKEKDRNESMDLLLLTQGWRSYIWDVNALKEIQLNNDPVIEDGFLGKLLPLKRNKVENLKQALILFNAEQNVSQVIEASEENTFQVSADNLQIGKDIYIKHFGQPSDFKITVSDPFQKLNEIQIWKNIQYPYLESHFEKKDDSTKFDLMSHSIKLEEVLINAKKENVFRDKYIGSLDSLAKFQNNTDRAHGSWLNCPAGDGDELPIEGKTYIVWTGPNPPSSHPFTFNSTNTKRIVYRYPKYTEEELMKMYGITRTKGYYPEKVFYEPDYDNSQEPSTDFRNTLLWAPNIITDKNGEATLEFFTSDLNSVFMGIIEGIGADGSFGKSVFQLRVTQ